MLNTDGEIVWGPDPHLTPKGEEQARAVNFAWKAQIQDNVPVPRSLYSSPLRRSADTLNITWSDILLNPSDESQQAIVPTIKENFRETIGIHTCDKRSDKSVIQSEKPGWKFENMFTEHDELWNDKYMESEGQHALRVQAVLNELFVEDGSSVIGITSHSGNM